MGGAVKMGDWFVRGLRFVVVLVVLAGLAEFGDGWHEFERLFIIVALIFLVTLVHEFGHAIAVWRQRGVVLKICVFGLTYKPGRREVAFEQIPGGGDIAGFVGYLPPEEDWTRGQYAAVAAGGPLADVMLGLAALALVAIAPVLEPSSPTAPVAVAIQEDQLREPAPRAGAFLPSTAEMARISAEVERRDSRRALSKGTGQAGSMLALLAFASAVLNLLPYRGSDGAQLLELWRGRNRFARTPKRR